MPDIEEIKNQLKQVTIEDVRGVMRWIANEELPRREKEAEADAARAEMVKELQAEGQLPHPDVLPADAALPTDVALVPEWKDPGTNHALMYHKGDRVRHNGKVVRSTHDGLNHWEPGTLQLDGRIWVEEVLPPAEEEEEVPPEEEGEQPVPAFVQPTGGHDAYSVNDLVVYDGSVYESVINNNVWSPAAYPQGWSFVSTEQGEL